MVKLFDAETGALTVELPDLQGTSKQIPYAERKRFDFYFLSQKLEDKSAQKAAEKLCAEKLDANFWMDNWNLKADPMDFIRKHAKVHTFSSAVSRIYSVENIARIKALMADNPFLTLTEIAAKMQISNSTIGRMYWLMTVNNPILNKLLEWGLITSNFVQELKTLFPLACTNKEHAKGLFDFMPIVLQVYEETNADEVAKNINLLRWALATAAKKHLKQENSAKEESVASIPKNRKITELEFNLVRDFVRNNPFSSANVTEIANATKLDVQIVNAILWLLAIKNVQLNQFAVQGTMDLAALHRLQSMFPNALTNDTDLEKLDNYIARLYENQVRNLSPEVQTVKPQPVSVEVAKENKVQQDSGNPMEKLEAFIKANAVPDQYANSLREEVQKRLFSPERIKQLADKFLLEMAI